MHMDLEHYERIRNIISAMIKICAIEDWKSLYNSYELPLVGRKVWLILLREKSHKPIFTNAPYSYSFIYKTR
jgi:hypothetical protein